MRSFAASRLATQGGLLLNVNHHMATMAEAATEIGGSRYPTTTRAEIPQDLNVKHWHFVSRILFMRVNIFMHKKKRSSLCFLLLLFYLAVADLSNINFEKEWHSI